MNTHIDFKNIEATLDDHAMVSVANADGVIIYVNDKLVEISGYSESELIGKKHSIFNSGIHFPSFYRQMWETLLSGKIWQGEVCDRTKSGKLQWFKTSIKPLADTNGLPIQFVYIRNPISKPQLKGIATHLDENSPLSILLVEDSKSQAMMLIALLQKFGHIVHHSYSGEDAVEQFRQIMPDLVLMDISLPGIDGYEATKIIRAEHPEWVPIIFLSGLKEVSDKLRALEVGGDDFFLKPVDHDELFAKLKVMGRIHAMQKKLTQYKLKQEEDNELAALVMNRYLRASQADPRVEFSILSATQHFSGDAVTVAKTPDGGLNVMLLDAMGHGLPAAINVMPAIQSFYALSKKGISLEMLVSELNNIVCEFSPTGHFLAATILNLDPTASILSGWIGGAPKVLINNPGGIQCYASKNLSLGVQPTSKLKFEFFNSPWSENSMLVTCTDGVIESTGSNGTALGEQWILDIVEQYGNILDKSLFDQLWKASLGDHTPQDDASILIIKQYLLRNA